MKGLSGAKIVAFALLLWFVASSQDVPSFVDASSGISFRADGSPTSRKYLLETMVGGVGVIDFNSDGRLDVFFVNGAKLSDPMTSNAVPEKREERYWNRLYRNDGNGRFTDVTVDSGLQGKQFGMGVAVGDYDNDGRSDLYVTNFGRNALYHNEGGGKFVETTDRAGVTGGGWSTGATFVDVDADGRLDLFVARYLSWAFNDIWCGDKTPALRAYCHPKHFEPVSHLLYRNNGDGTFSDISAASGIAAHKGKGLGVAIDDFDRDGKVDILVANDSFPQQLFHNLGQGKFEEVGLGSGIAYDDDGQTFAGMGVNFADYNNDGWPDAFINALGNQRYALFQNVGKSFEYVSGPSGVGQATMLNSGWGTHFIDYDNDGWQDLFVAQGHVMDNIALTQPSLRYLEPFLLLKNERGKFVNVSGRAGEAFGVPRAARGSAMADFNDDGAMDLVVACLGQSAVLLKNTTAFGNHWLTIQAVGTRSNRDAIGTRIRVVSSSGAQQFGMVRTAGSYLSSSDKRVHFGLGKDSSVKLLEISWPSGIVQKMTDVKADQVLRVTEPQDANVGRAASR